MVDKYLNGVFSQFQVKSQDGTIDESINIHELIVEDVLDCVEFLKSLYESKLSDKMLEVFLEFCLIQGIKNINENRDLIIKASGESNDKGN